MAVLTLVSRSSISHDKQKIYPVVHTMLLHVAARSLFSIEII